MAHFHRAQPTASVPPPKPEVVGKKVAVLVPCHNEAASIQQVVWDFRNHLPAADIYVCDNASTDNTARLAADAGAIVYREPLLGKGNVVRRMFADIEADIYVMVDGDGTYDPGAAPKLIEHLLANDLDMVNCARVAAEEGAYRPGHKLGNRVLTGLVARVFGRRLSDMLSGYRVMTRRFVKSFPALSTGFEIETEITIHALELRVPLAELSAPYSDRPRGSVSKLRTISDGVRILRVILHMVKEERPLQFFSAIFGLLAMASIGLGIPVTVTFFETGQVPRLPTALLATGLMLVAFMSLMCGLILDTVTRGRREFKRLLYLSSSQQR